MLRDLQEDFRKLIQDIIMIFTGMLTLIVIIIFSIFKND